MSQVPRRPDTALLQRFIHTFKEGVIHAVTMGKDNLQPYNKIPHFYGAAGIQNRPLQIISWL